MNKISKFKALAVAMVLFPSIAGAEIFVTISDPSGTSAASGGYDKGKFFVVDSFSFGVEREMKESGEKGGTQDINIGVGELQPVTITKLPDSMTAMLAQASINGYSIGDVEICVTDDSAVNTTACYLEYKLHNCYIKSWSVSGDADDRPTEEVAFYYNKIAFQYANTNDGKEFDAVSWDKDTGRSWPAGELAL